MLARVCIRGSFESSAIHIHNRCLYLEVKEQTIVLLGIPGKPPLMVVAYADDVSVFTSGTVEEVVSVMRQYAEASGSKINRDKSEIFWMGEEGEGFELPDAFPDPRQEIKVLGIKFYFWRLQPCKLGKQAIRCRCQGCQVEGL